MADKQTSVRDDIQKALDEKDYIESLGNALGRVAGGALGGAIIGRARKGFRMEPTPMDRFLPAIGATAGAIGGMSDIRAKAGEIKNRKPRK